MKIIVRFRFCLGFSLNRQSIFDNPSTTLILFNDVKEVFPDERSGQFILIESYHTATAIISTTSVGPSRTMNTTMIETFVSNVSQRSSFPSIDHLYHQNAITTSSSVVLKSRLASRLTFDWFYTYLKHMGVRSLIFICLISVGVLFILLSLIFYLQCKHRQSIETLTYPYHQTNGKSSSQFKRSAKRSCPKLFHYFHSNSTKPSSFRLTSNGSVSRLNSGDSYHLISSIQENHKEKNRTLLHSSTPPTLYHQVNRVLLPHEETNGTLRSLKKDFDHLTRQTYSAVYSCELAANLDLDQENHSLIAAGTAQRRRSMLKTPSSTQEINSLVYVFMKNLVDCFALQIYRTNLLATADDNRLQLCHARVSLFYQASKISLSSIERQRVTFISSRDIFILNYL